MKYIKKNGETFYKINISNQKILRLHIDVVMNYPFYVERKLYEAGFDRSKHIDIKTDFENNEFIFKQ